MSRRWRVGILGLGHWYSAYNLARALREYPRAELVSVAWHNKRQRDAFTSTFGVPGYESCDELLERDRVDIVHIAAPVSDIHDLTIPSARAGKHIILGKPMAMISCQIDSHQINNAKARRSRGPALTCTTTRAAALPSDRPAPRGAPADNPPPPPRPPATRSRRRPRVDRSA